MKKFLLCILLCIPIATLAEAHSYMFTGFQIKSPNEDWGKWEDVHVRATINLDYDQIIIYSKEVQIFKVKSTETFTNEQGEELLRMRCTDSDGTKCRVDAAKPKGKLSLVIRYSNIEYAYVE